MKSNHAARRQLGLSYKPSGRHPYPWVFLYRPTPNTREFLLNDWAKTQAVMAVRFKPELFCGLVIDAYRYYPVSAFYPAHVANGRVKG